MDIEIPRDHPRYESLINREKLIEGCEKKIVAPAGLIAHGRGEAFDYLIGEETADFAVKAIDAAAAALLLASRPVLSVNGNLAALCAQEIVRLAQVSHAPLEINLFYRSPEREEAILDLLKQHGAVDVMGVGTNASATIPELGSERRRVDPQGILQADLVFVPLEDGDRTEALVKMGKRVITVDLNPLSRTAQKAQITIIDNIIRVMPLLIGACERLQKDGIARQEAVLKDYDNRKIIASCLKFISRRLNEI